MAVTVVFILLVEDVVNGATYGDGFHMWQLEGVSQVEVAHEIWVEAVFLVLEVVEVLTAHILRSELCREALEVELNHAVADK